MYQFSIMKKSLHTHTKWSTRIVSNINFHCFVRVISNILYKYAGAKTTGSNIFSSGKFFMKFINLSRA